MGSIPAYAGEPWRPVTSDRVPPVYPRLRGGTRASAKLLGHALGLSPPTRGNLIYQCMKLPADGSIPAYAGEPDDSPSFALDRTVYPRLRGGTLDGGYKEYDIAGLSPPTRGNRRGDTRLVADRRSIPAYAGEPVFFGRIAVADEVYPRLRGGTSVV